MTITEIKAAIADTITQIEGDFFNISLQMQLAELESKLEAAEDSSPFGGCRSWE